MFQSRRLASIRRLLGLQALIVVALPSLLLLYTVQAAYSALLGGLVCLLPNLYFAYLIFNRKVALVAERILRAYYLGEAIKMVFTASLFTLVFVYVKPLDASMLFLGFVSVQLAAWITLLSTKRV